MSHSAGGHRWPLFILFLGLAFVCLTSWSIYRAVSEVSAPVSRAASER
ncbi:MAG: hypothetical protein IH614_17685 [Desulfuromonadales bacterium]|nr:hypothetical protein [Desulfuromonadales bacterium]